MSVILPIFANLILLTAMLGFGSLLRALIPQSFSRVDRLALTLLGGLGLLGTLLFCMGQVWFSRTAIFLVLLGGVLLALKTLIRSGPHLRTLVGDLSIPVLPGLVIGAVLTVTMLGGFAEPTGDIRMDAISCHLLSPKIWLRDAVIRPVIDESTTAFPTLVETQYSALMALGGQRAPGLFAAIGLVLILLVAVALARRSGLDAHASWWVAALIVTMPVVYRGAFGSFVDAIYCSFVLAAARLAFDALEPRQYLLVGLFSGFAMGTKYFGLFAGLLLSVCVILIAITNNQEKARVIKSLGIAGATAVVIAAPWYVRNWILLGCPIYPPPPILLPYFHVKYFPVEGLQLLLVRIVREGRGMGHDLFSFLLLPFHLTFHPANFINGAGGIGLTPLALSPFGLFVCRKNAFAMRLALFAVMLTITWFAIAQEARYLIHGYVIAAMFAVWGWSYVATVSPRVGRILAGLTVACSILYGMIMIGLARRDDVHAVVSRSFAEKRRSEEIPFLASFEYLNKQPSAGKVLLLDPRVPGYYLDEDYLKPRGRNGEQVLPEGANLPRILTELSSLQISYVLDVKWEGGTFVLPDQPEGLTLVFEREDQRVYKVN